MKKILLLQLPPAVEQALTEHLATLSGFAVLSAGKDAHCHLRDDPDLVITGGAARVPGCPVLALSFAQPQRLGALLRQVGRMIAQPVLYMDDVPLGDYTFRPQEKSMALPDGSEAALTDREVDILAYLIRHRAAPVGREDLLKNVWQYQAGVDTHTLETHIYRLRQKIEASADNPQLLLTTEGGYRLHLPAGAVS